MLAVVCARPAKNTRRDIPQCHDCRLKICVADSDAKQGLVPGRKNDFEQFVGLTGSEVQVLKNDLGKCPAR
jgi:hypothetical protein